MIRRIRTQVGGGRKSLRGSVEASLRNLGTDHIDLLYLHAWDGLTPSDEIIASLGELVRAGKVLYIGISDTPAWEVARMQTTAELRGWPCVAALQVEYSLIERTTERELLPMAANLGIGVVAWAPLGGGVLAGKYTSADLATVASRSPAGTRRDQARANGTLTARGLEIADIVVDVARELGVTAAQVALAWTLRHPSVVSSLIGARTVEQLQQNTSALDVVFDEKRSSTDCMQSVPSTPGFPTIF